MTIFYFKTLDEGGNVKNLITYNNIRPNITNPLIAEITKEEYDALLAELFPQASEEPEMDEINAEEALDIILRGETA